MEYLYPVFWTMMVLLVVPQLILMVLYAKQGKGIALLYGGTVAFCLALMISTKTVGLPVDFVFLMVVMTSLIPFAAVNWGQLKKEFKELFSIRNDKEAK